MSGKSRHLETEMIRTQTERSSHREHSAPIYATSSFMYESAEQAARLFQGEEEGHIYSRYSNPNNDELIQKLCLAEGMDMGIATASGMAAMFTSMAAFLEQGDHVVASRSLFGSTHQIITKLFPKWGITHTYVDIDQPDTWEAAIRPNTKMILAETPSNPGLDILDMKKMGELAKAYGLLFNVDNCFATPYLQNPADFGADIVSHSATKFIDGQGRVLGGAVLVKEALWEDLLFMSRHTGPSMSPFHGWLLSKSMETLAIRMKHHCEQALGLAKFLEEQKSINWVKYPFLTSHAHHELAKQQMRGGGGMVSFEVSGGAERGVRFMNALEMISLSSNLGDTRTICTHPTSTTHSKLSEDERLSVSITPGLIRVSVGFEHLEDIQQDIVQALDRSA